MMTSPTISIVYIVEAMIGCGPNDDANLIAHTVAESFPNVQLTILVDSVIPHAAYAPNVNWVPLSTWRTNPRHFSFLTLEGETVEEPQLEERSQKILDILESTKPDAVILHNYLSGLEWDNLLRKSYLPVIQAVKNLPASEQPLLFSFLLGMVDSFEDMTPQEVQDYKEYALSQVDHVFLRSDSKELFLDTCPPARTFPEFFTPVGYTASPVRPEERIQRIPSEVIVSGGGGDEANHLFEAAIKARALARRQNHHLAQYRWRIFIGPLGKKFREGLKTLATEKLQLSEDELTIQDAVSSSEFVERLYRDALVSVSQCGQRTFSDLEVTCVPALIIPRESGGAEKEQLYRARYMERQERAAVLQEAFLSPQLLIMKLDEALGCSQTKLGVDLNGAPNLIKKVQEFVFQKKFLDSEQQTQEGASV